MAIQLTATGSGYFKVLKDSVEQSQHTTEREASEVSVNAKLSSPESVVSYYHDYAVRVDIVADPPPADVTAPTAVVSVADTYLSPGESTLVTITFSEPVVNFSNANVTVDNGVLDTLVSADGGITWTGTFTPSAGLDDPANVAMVAGYQDAAGNVGLLAVSDNYAINTVVVNPPSTHPLELLQPGEWYEFPNSKMNSVDPCPAKTCSYSGITGQAGVMNAWSSGCYDTLRDRLLVFGGGHSDYGGNEIYAFGPLTSETPAWSRVTEPSVPTGGGAELNADGTPSSRHTYGTLQYDPVRDTFMMLSGGSLFNMSSATGSKRCHGFSFETGTWKTDYPYWTPGDIHNTASEWDPISQVFWVKNSFSTQMAKFDPAGNGGLGLWAGVGASWYSNPYMVLAVDTNRHVLWGIGGSNGRLNKIDLNANNVRTNPVTTGDAGGIALEVAQAPGFVYDIIGDRLIAWRGGRDVFQLDPDTLVWTRLQNVENAVDPGAANAAGTYGRFRYIARYNGCIVVNKNTGSVFFYKLGAMTEAVNPPPLVNGVNQSLQEATFDGGIVNVGAGSLYAGASVTLADTSVVGAGIDQTFIKGGAVLGKGQLVVSATASIEGLTLQDAVVPDNNGAGIRHQAGQLFVSDVKFLRCQNGYLGDLDVDFLRVICDSCGIGDGLTHGIYAGAANLVTVTDSQFRGTKVGHHLKSRSKETRVNNVVMEAATESYSCDFPWGGAVSIDSLTATQGPDTGNSVMINYGSEVNPAPHAAHSFSIANSTLVSQGVANAIAIRIDSKTPVIVHCTNVAFSGFSSLVAGSGVLGVVYTGCTNNGVPIPDTP